MHVHLLMRRSVFGAAIAGLAFLGWLSLVRTVSYFDLFKQTHRAEYPGLLDSLLPKLDTAAPRDIPLLIAALDVDDLLIRQTAFTALQKVPSDKVHRRFIRLFEQETNHDFLIRIARELALSYPGQLTVDVFRRELSRSRPLAITYFLSALHLFILTDDDAYLKKITQCMASNSYTLRYIYLLWSEEACHPVLIPLLERYYLFDAQFLDDARRIIEFIQESHQEQTVS